MTRQLGLEGIAVSDIGNQVGDEARDHLMGPVSMQL
jgi:hypothetical protein